GLTRGERCDLVTVKDAWFVVVDDCRFGARRCLPLTQERMCGQRFEVSRRGAGERHAVGAEAERNGRVENIRQAEGAHQVRAVLAETLSRFGPKLDDTRDIAGEPRRPWTDVDPLADAHRHVVAEIREPRMHLA